MVSSHKVLAVTSYDIEHCPKKSLLGGHYKADGSCLCSEYLDALAAVAAAYHDVTLAAERLARATDWLVRT